MAQILYPPYIEGKLPAQCGEELHIPFQFNRTTGADDVVDSNLLARIKGINTNSIITELKTTNYNDNIAIFTLVENKLEIGQYYKIQLAWEGSSYYSTIGVFKYTTETNLELITINQQFLTMQCNYITQDIGEKVYCYSYKIYDHDDILYYQSPQIMNNATFIQENNNIYLLPLIFDVSMLTREQNKEYGIDINIQTINSLIHNSFSIWFELQIPDEKLALEVSIQESINAISCANNISDGTLRRKKQEENLWQVLTHQFNDIWYDKTLEHGVEYEYELYADGEIGNLISQPLYFDDMYLSDKDKNYCIQFNPKVSSFKTNILEQRQNTLGGKYPVFIRNGQTDYVEFGISGLISYLMNRPEETEPQRTETNSTHKDSIQSATNLIGENIYKERIFRTELIKWLNNGQPKLFRSPTEGNFIVRITNVSLTPNDTLGRMLYTFNCTAVEVTECNYENLRKYNLVE